VKSQSAPASQFNVHWLLHTFTQSSSQVHSPVQLVFTVVPLVVPFGVVPSPNSTESVLKNTLQPMAGVASAQMRKRSAMIPFWRI
jgi:fumarate reductase subunit D